MKRQAVRLSPKRGRHTIADPVGGYTGKHQGLSGQEAVERRAAWASTFTVVSTGRSRQGRVSRLRIG